MKFNKDKFLYEFRKNQASDEEIHENVLEGMNVHGANFIILMCAIIIASVGLNMNATAVIIGAMLISPLMGCIIGIGYGVGTYDIKLIKDGFRILIISVSISLFTSTIYFIVSPISTAGSEILSRTSPTIWDVVIAFTGGVAGMIGLTRKKASNVIPGVAIATALMPPLCTGGYGIAISSMKIFLGAVYLFFINCFFITVATFILTKVLDLPTKAYVNGDKQKKIKSFLMISGIIVIIPSMFSAINMINETIDEGNLNDFIDKQLNNQYVLEKSITKNNIELILVGEELSNDEINDLKIKINDYGFEDKDLIIKQDSNDSFEMEKYIEELRDENNTLLKDNIISNKTENLNITNNLNVDEISDEIKSIYPQINEINLGYLKSDIDDKEVINMIIYMDEDLLEEEITKISEWLKNRLNAEYALVYIEKNKLNNQSN